MPLGEGHFSYIQVSGPEATWGATTAATRKLGLVSHDLRLATGAIRSKTPANKVVRGDIFKGGQIVQGKLVLEASYEGQDLFWELAMGTATYASLGGATTGASAPYTHTWTNKARLNSLNLEIQEGSIPDATHITLIKGVKVNRLALRGEASQEGDLVVCNLELDIVGIGMASNTAYTSGLTLHEVEPILMHHLTTVDDGCETTGVNLRAFELAIENNLNVARYYGGSVNPLEFMRNDYCKVSLKITEDFQNHLALVAALAHTASSPRLMFTNSGAGAALRTLDLAIGAAYLVEPMGHPINKYGLLEQELVWEAIESSSTGITVAMQNSLAAIS
jgi:hypothetical protein